MKEVVITKKPLVSTKMITYNHGPYIAQAIEGVLIQETDFPIELVIGEDCSTDGTREVVFDYQKRYPDIIRIITSDKNVGAQENSLRTEKACRGKYIAYCDGDDYWHHPQKLQKQVEYLEKYPNCGLVFTDFDIFYVENRKRIRNYRQYYNKKTDFQGPKDKLINSLLRAEYGNLTCTVCVRKHLLDKVVASDQYLFQSNHFLMGDVQCWSGILQVSDMYCINESMVTHNVLLESASQSRNRMKRLRFNKSSAELNVYLASKYNLSKEDQCFFQRRLLRCLLKLAFFEKNDRLACDLHKEYPQFGFKDKMLYWGIRNKLFNLILRPFLWRN